MHIKDNNLKYEQYTDLSEVIPKADIIYMTRIQRERFSDPIEYEKTRINAFSNLLQKFTFGTGEERFGIGQDIKSVEKLVNSGFDINARNIAESERSRILSFSGSL